ncbi:bifunctional 3-deoxy-7-phosphoheptulonate synthase/chorismate mutase type II [Hymenobacter weizhouensis]|uniref:bifunctional 3-deoxy-7-phosphoheptulonate synthase/chorismate mutase type II n=1 Tax=Hymenobacter sp. YIM 151500-1 TaxID=2987689 RepID=UPI002226B1BB|nr:bifunctional 3-deoxy-7-phosphoheptulonate synthase/chorismate mutase type II [Hymenobacter sp. YIM 151500-1]UYZ65124.1 bifunctional 3-deoxy-7-phosphoheptulonate synthase/chorismate mutase type II [Hymenobacter sp. YIM 151500-1]
MPSVSAPETYFTRLLHAQAAPLLIAGPCSAETEEQVLATAHGLRALGRVQLFRAGVWKPRTRPGSFEGRGAAALPWLQRVKAETGLPVTIEVATPRHVEEALAYGVDVLWIGARTTVNPFAVQELADALAGTGVPVMVKNPVNPDVALWAGALERLERAGIRDLAAIHRGFSTFAPSRYRNAPTWALPIELKTRFPHIPLICDPSHIGGRRDLLLPIAQKALDLDYDGLMIETHPTPDQALSDAEQQITPQRLGELLQELKYRYRSSDNAEYRNKAEELRQKMDVADREIIEALARRMSLVEELAEYKRENNVKILQLDRWQEIFASRRDWAGRVGVNEKFVAELYKLIHIESIRKQTEILQRPE